MSEQAAIGKAIEQQAASGVLAKLIIFSVSLGAVPLSSYFLTLKYLWPGNFTLSAITAVVSANLVLVAYIVVSVLEDKQEQNVKASLREKKKQ